MPFLALLFKSETIIYRSIFLMKKMNMLLKGLFLLLVSSFVSGCGCAKSHDNPPPVKDLVIDNKITLENNKFNIKYAYTN